MPEKPKVYTINYEIAAYSEADGQGFAGVLPPPDSFIKNIKEAFASVGEKVSVEYTSGSCIE